MTIKKTFTRTVTSTARCNIVVNCAVALRHIWGATHLTGAWGHDYWRHWLIVKLRVDHCNLFWWHSRHINSWWQLLTSRGNIHGVWISGTGTITRWRRWWIAINYWHWWWIDTKSRHSDQCFIGRAGSTTSKWWRICAGSGSDLCTFRVTLTPTTPGTPAPINRNKGSEQRSFYKHYFLWCTIFILETYSHSSLKDWIVLHTIISINTTTYFQCIIRTRQIASWIFIFSLNTRIMATVTQCTLINVKF